MTQTPGGFNALTLRVLNDVVSRAGLAKKSGQSYGDDRDLYDTLGYPDQPSFDDFLSFYLRGDVAARIVDMPADDTWKDSPVVRSVGSNEDADPFAEDVGILDDERRLFHYMKRADRIAGIGNFAIIVIGARGDGGLDTELSEGSLKGPEDVLYFATYHQGSAEITGYGENPSEPRFGLPTEYTVNLGGTTIGEVEHRDAATDAKVHWSRVIHVPSDNLVEDDVHGMPRLQRVLNRFIDMAKLVGGGAEVVWQNVAGIWHADLDPEVEATAEEMEQFEDDIQAAMHRLQRLLQTRGVDLNLLAGDVPDITSLYAAQKQLICASAGIPERKLFGSERGELASSQDEKTWNGTVESRRSEHAEPVILRAMLDRLVWLGAIRPPTENGYEVDWPPLEEPTQAEIAGMAKDYADAISKLAPAGAPDLLIAPWEARTEILRLPAVMPPMPENYAEALGDSEPDEGDDDAAV